MTYYRIIRRNAAVGGSWLPSDLSTITGWWDASDSGSVTTSSGNVTLIADQTANNYDLGPASGGTLPHSSETINSLDTIRVGNSGSASNVLYISGGIPLSSGDDFLFAWVGRIRTGVNDASAWFRTDSDATGNHFFQRELARWNGTNFDYTDITSTGVEIWTFAVDSAANIRVRKNGTEYYSSTHSTATGAVSIHIFGRNHLHEPMLSDWGEWFVAKTYTLEDSEKAEGYLAHKWGLASNLPIGHPYKGNAP